MTKTKRDLICGIGFLLYSIFFFVGSFFIRMAKINTVSARFMPRLISISIFVLAVLLIIRSVKTMRGEAVKVSTPSQRAQSSKSLRTVWLVIVILLAGAILLPYIGFVLTMTVVLFLVFTLLEEKENRRYPLYITLSLVLPISMQLLFFYGFSVILPIGVLDFLKYL